MQTVNFGNLVTPDGFYSLWCMPSRAEVVSMLVGKYGKPAEALPIETAEELVNDNISKDSSLENEYQSTFVYAGIRFNFIGTWIDVKELPRAAIWDLERMKESKCKGYAYFKKWLGMPALEYANI